LFTISVDFRCTRSAEQEQDWYHEFRVSRFYCITVLCHLYPGLTTQARDIT